MRTQLSTQILENVNSDHIDSKSKRAFGPFSLSLDDIRPHFLNPDLSDAELVHLIQEMSSKFTKNRSQIGDYVQDEDRVSAYAALYLPTNIPKLHFLLSNLPEAILEDLKNRTFIDIGSGPGTFSLGWSLLFETPPKEIVCVDSSKLMQEQAALMVKGFFSEANIRTQSKFIEKSPESVLFYGHSINEMGIEKVQSRPL